MWNAKVLSALGGALVLASATLAHASWFKDELPPDNSKPLSQIVKILEDQGYKAINEVEFDDGVWNVEVQLGGGKELHLKVAPLTGEIVSR